MKVYTTEELVKKIDELVGYYKDSFFYITPMTENAKVGQILINTNSKIEALNNLRELLIVEDK